MKKQKCIAFYIFCICYDSFIFLFSADRSGLVFALRATCSTVPRIVSSRSNPQCSNFKANPNFCLSVEKVCAFIVEEVLRQLQIRAASSQEVGSMSARAKQEAKAASESLGVICGSPLRGCIRMTKPSRSAWYRGEGPTRGRVDVTQPVALLLQPAIAAQGGAIAPTRSFDILFSGEARATVFSSRRNRSISQKELGHILFQH